MSLHNYLLFKFISEIVGTGIFLGIIITLAVVALVQKLKGK
ncbi:hypothetical protein [Sporolactobacillus shoreae]|nr:hypothetical protein [Sporolactobacillus shoreae]